MVNADGSANIANRDQIIKAARLMEYLHTKEEHNLSELQLKHLREAVGDKKLKVISSKEADRLLKDLFFYANKKPIIKTKQNTAQNELKQIANNAKQKVDITENKAKQVLQEIMSKATTNVERFKDFSEAQRREILEREVLNWLNEVPSEEELSEEEDEKPQKKATTKKQKEAEQETIAKIRHLAKNLANKEFNSEKEFKSEVLRQLVANKKLEIAESIEVENSKLELADSSLNEKNLIEALESMQKRGVTHMDENTVRPIYKKIMRHFNKGSGVQTSINTVTQIKTAIKNLKDIDNNRAIGKAATTGRNLAEQRLAEIAAVNK